MLEKIEPIKKTFQEKIKGFDIEVIELMKNGFSFKNVFKLTLNGKEYKKLSLGEKTKLDIAISQTINELLEEKIDMFFLDNSESLDEIPKINGQSFICKVNNEDLNINKLN